ncbi:M23 family metallopeptidase [Streptomyces sp. G44]|uniref:M23 family metallopeptidase n=1 Tax=Streptomyces sp. G44 TaxID=2807632 RepID=UPI0019611C0D|nr:M23 family metallopeptidase [Streptomyces sp. G44]MBM7173169.1 M23 family metallopeptidase [Streptomyces sp. G44]
MDHHIDEARPAPPTRRDALRAAAGFLAVGAVPVTAFPAAASHSDGTDVCTGGYDVEFETALAEAAARLDADDNRAAFAPERPPGRYALPLRRGFRVSARYGVRGDWLAGHHTGIDLAVPTGTPVYAVASGVVVLARRSGSYGKAVTVRLRDGHYAVFAHLSRITVRQGAAVRAGARIGSSGATGRATGPHLHLEIRSRRGYGSDIDPVRYLARRGARLL